MNDGPRISWKFFVEVAVLAASLLFVTGCACLMPAAAETDAEPVAAEPEPALTPEPAPTGGCPSVSVSGDTRTSVQLFPTGDRRSSVLMVKTKTAQEAMVGQEFDHTVEVANLTDCKLYNVVVEETFPDSLKLKASSPQARFEGGRATWNVGDLAPRSRESIKARLVSAEAGTYEHCVMVDYDTAMCQTVLVVAPELQVRKNMPESVLLCDSIPITLKVGNTGTGTIRDVTVTDKLPNGMRSMDGRQSVTYNIPSLAGGQTETLSFRAKAAKTGKFTNTVNARSASGLSDEASAAVTVHQPVLAIAKKGTETQFAGRNLSYDIMVKNTGDAPAANLMVRDPLPQGTDFVSASDGGRVSAGQVVWNLGSLAAGKQADMTLKLKAMTVGTVRNKVTASATCADAVSATATSNVVGIPAILLEVVDVEDPIEVGDVETYIITVTNQGTQADRNIKIVCTLPAEQSFVAAGGATDGSADGKTVTFAPLDRLAPKAEAQWTVKAKAEKTNTIRFRVEMTSDFLKPPPVEETEATNQY